MTLKVGHLGRYDMLDMLGNECNLSTVLLVLEKIDFTNPFSFLFRLEHATFVFIPKIGKVP